jgi:hypothetical protein
LEFTSYMFLDAGVAGREVFNREAKRLPCTCQSDQWSLKKRCEPVSSLHAKIFFGWYSGLKVTRMKSLSCISVLDIFVYLPLKVSTLLLWV